MKKRAFTLAEMMVVMLILTIVLAAFAPMMTKRRSEGSGDNPWKWAVNNNDAYFGLSAGQTAMIGQKEKASDDPSVKLLINSPNGSFMAFKSGDNVSASFSTSNGFKFTGPAGSSTDGAVTSTAFGAGALSLTNTKNTAFGYNALHNTSGGTENVAVGMNALSTNTTGSGNTAVGYGALADISNSSYNTAVGYMACANSTATSSSGPVTCIGFGAGPNSLPSGVASAAKGNIYLGRSSTGSGNTDTVHVGELYIQGQQFQSSDRRLKNVKAEYSKGLEQIRLIQPYNYTFKNNKDERVGVIAQDLQSVLPEAVNKNDDGYLSIKQENIFYTLVNAVKQLDKLVQGLIGEVKTILVKLQTHDEEIQKLKKENKELKQRLEKLEKALS